MAKMDPNMKTTLTMALVALALLPTWSTVRAAESLSETLQKGLFEEEANHNLASAIKAYQVVVQRADEQRKLTATAVFRLGECYRKLGKTNEAAGQYERILREFPDQDQLAGVSQQNLFALGVKPAAGTNPAVQTISDPEQVRLLEEEIKLVESQVKTAEARQANGTGTTVDVLQAKRALLPLQRQLPANAAISAQAGLIEQQIQLVEQLRQSVEARVKVGQAAPLDAVPVQRELFSLKRELASLSAPVPGGKPPGEALGATDEEQQEVRRIKALIKDSPDLINSVGAESLWTPLHKAAANGQLVVARFLLANKADVNAREKGGIATPLVLAASRGHKSMVELLLAHGADVSLPGAAGNQTGSPLHLAAANGFLSVAEVLLANKADVNARNNEGKTPLHLAAAEGRLPLAEMLLAKGAEVNAKDAGGRGPLHGAVQQNQAILVDFLLASKADANLADTDEISPLFLAVRNKNLNITASLLKNGAEVNSRCGGNPQIRWALDSSSPQLVKLLLGYKPKLEVPDQDNLTALQAAIYNDRIVRAAGPEMLELLLASGANVDTPFTPTHGAQWLERNARRDDTVITGNTPLMVAIRRKRVDLAEVLLAHGAQVNTKSPDGKTALHYAVESGSLPLVAAVLARHPDLEVRDQKGSTPFLSAGLDDTRIMQALISAGANLNAAYPSGGYTKLHVAVGSGRKDLVDLLATNQANVNLMDSQGDTPLVLAERRGSGPFASNSAVMDEIANFLIKHGADENIRRRSFITASRKERSWSLPVYFRGTNGFNHYTLLELIASTYAGTPNQPSFAFPDLVNVKIKRLNPKKGGDIEVNLDLEQVFQSGDCQHDVSLEWGDIVEIPELDHGINEGWLGLTRESAEMLQKCLRREVSIVVRGETTKVVLMPSSAGLGGFGGRPRIPIATAPLTTKPGPAAPSAPDSWKPIRTFRLKEVVNQSNVVRLSSDLTHVKVQRIDPKLGRQEFVFDLSESAPYDSRTDLWLREGDVIEVPEK